VEAPRPEASELLVRVEVSSVNGFGLGTAAGASCVTGSEQLWALAACDGSRAISVRSCTRRGASR
jgi:hypothetical protein